MAQLRYPYISVPWLHLHTFIGAVPSEHLPSVPPRAACTSATVTCRGKVVTFFFFGGGKVLVGHQYKIHKL